MDLVVPEPEAPRQPVGTGQEYALILLLSNIGIPNSIVVVVGRNLRLDFPQGCISSVGVCRWQHVQQKKKYVPRTVLSCPLMGKQQKGTFCVHCFRKAYNASEEDKILKFLR